MFPPVGCDAPCPPSVSAACAASFEKIPHPILHSSAIPRKDGAVYAVIAQAQQQTRAAGPDFDEDATKLGCPVA
eukprot:1152424-Rhodomonas_salina.1